MNQFGFQNSMQQRMNEQAEQMRDWQRRREQRRGKHSGECDSRARMWSTNATNAAADGHVPMDEEPGAQAP